MSKRSEEAALDYQLRKFGPNVIGGANILSEEEYKALNMNHQFKDGYEQAEKDLGWHSVDECLPPYDEEVIVLVRKTVQIGESGNYLVNEYISYGHRPNPEGWNGKNIKNGEVKHYDVKTYDGWNIPGVHHWMYCPKLLEDNI